MYIVVRTWANAGALIDAIEQRQQEVSDVIGTVPGFVAYYATRSGDTLTTVTVTEDKEGSGESTRRAGEWVQKNLRRGIASRPAESPREKPSSNCEELAKFIRSRDPAKQDSDRSAPIEIVRRPDSQQTPSMHIAGDRTRYCQARVRITEGPCGGAQ